MSDNQTAIIEIANIEPSPYGVKITDTHKKVYNVSKTKKDGTTSLAWNQLQTMELKAPNPLTETPGDQVEIWYKEVPNKHGGNSRYISSFTEAGGRSLTPVSAPRLSGHSEANRGQSGAFSGPKDDAFWEKQAYEKCCSLWIGQLMAGGRLTEDETVTFDVFWKYFQAIKADGGKRSAIPNSVANLESELPTIQVDEDLVESIPF